jgi:hypothetical protein
MPLIQWIMQNLGGGTAKVGGVTVGGTANVVQIYSYFPTGGIIVGGEAIIVVTGGTIPSMVDFLGGMSDASMNFKYPDYFAF